MGLIAEFVVNTRQTVHTFLNLRKITFKDCKIYKIKIKYSDFILSKDII